MAAVDHMGGRRLWRAIVLANVAVAAAIVVVGAFAMQLRLDAVKGQVLETATRSADRWLAQVQDDTNGQAINQVLVDNGARTTDYAFFEGAMSGTPVVALQFHEVDSAQSVTFVKNAFGSCRVGLERAFVVSEMNQATVSRLFTDTPASGCPMVLAVTNRFLPDSVRVGTFLRIAVDASEEYQVFLSEMRRSSQLAVVLAALGLGSTLLTALLAWRLSQRDQRIRYIAGHDALTGLGNRYSFHRELSMMVERNDEPRFVLLLLDLDGFKAVNDTLGHDHGDALLARVGSRLRAMVRSGDTVARLGGDEFALVLRGGISIKDAAELGGEIIEAINALDLVNGVPVTVSASVGVAAIPEHADTVEELLRVADIALYQVKENGKGHARVFNQQMEAAQQSKYAIRHALKRAVRTNSVPVAYQPIHATDTGELRGFEALARLSDEYGATFEPSDFIPIAEEMRLVDRLGASVLRAATADVAPLGDGLKVAVNVSPSQVTWQLMDDVKAALSLSGLQAHRLELEITESEAISASPDIFAIARALRTEGVSIALDDFGSGYANLTYLWELPLDRVKIDRSIFAAARSEPRAKAVVQRFGIFGTTIGLRMTAEGIETADQRQFAIESGYEEVQGFYFSEPLRPEDLPGYVEKVRQTVGAKAGGSGDAAQPFVWPSMEGSTPH